MGRCAAKGKGHTKRETGICSVSSSYPLIFFQRNTNNHLSQNNGGHMSLDLENSEKLAEYQHELDCSKMAYQLKLDNLKAQYQAQLAGQRESFKSTIQLGANATRGAFIINGAGIALMLSYMANAKEAPESITTVAPALWFFVIGVLLAVLLPASAYISQGYYTNEQDMAGDHFTAIAIALFLGSAGCFVFGVQRAVLIFGG